MLMGGLFWSILIHLLKKQEFSWFLMTLIASSLLQKQKEQYNSRVSTVTHLTCFTNIQENDPSNAWKTRIRSREYANKKKKKKTREKNETSNYSPPKRFKCKKIKRYKKKPKKLKNLWTKKKPKKKKKKQ